MIFVGFHAAVHDTAVEIDRRIDDGVHGMPRDPGLSFDLEGQPCNLYP